MLHKHQAVIFTRNINGQLDHKTINRIDIDAKQLAGCDVILQFIEDDWVIQFHRTMKSIGNYTNKNIELTIGINEKIENLISNKVAHGQLSYEVTQLVQMSSEELLNHELLHNKCLDFVYIRPSYQWLFQLFCMVNCSDNTACGVFMITSLTLYASSVALSYHLLHLLTATAKTKFFSTESIIAGIPLSIFCMFPSILLNQIRADVINKVAMSIEQVLTNKRCETLIALANGAASSYEIDDIFNEKTAISKVFMLNTKIKQIKDSKPTANSNVTLTQYGLFRNNPPTDFTTSLSNDFHRNKNKNDHKEYKPIRKLS